MSILRRCCGKSKCRSHDGDMFALCVADGNRTLSIILGAQYACELYLQVQDRTLSIAPYGAPLT